MRAVLASMGYMNGLENPITRWAHLEKVGCKITETNESERYRKQRIDDDNKCCMKIGEAIFQVQYHLANYGQLPKDYHLRGQS